MRIENKTNKAWDLLVAGDVESAYKAIRGSKLTGWDKEHIRQANFLKIYDYPELIKVKDENKYEFALVACWNFLIKYNSSTFNIDNFAPLLGNNFEFSGNINAIREVLGYPPLIFTPFIQEQYPELLTLSNLSLFARDLFIRMIKYAQIRLGGLVDTRVIENLDSHRIKQAFVDLSKAGLIKTGLTINELLPDLMITKTLKELKQFAFDHGVDFHGTKHQIIQAIVSETRHEAIVEWLDIKDEAEFIYPHVSNLSTLKEHIWIESGIFEHYLQWIYQTKCLNKTEQVIINERATKLMEKTIRDHYDPMEPWSPVLKAKKRSTDRTWKSKKMLLLKSIWDSDCDLILKDTIQRYAWDWKIHIEESIKNHFADHKLVAYKKASRQNSILQRFCEQRLEELNITGYQSRLIKCAHCGIDFMDWSITSDLAERVNYKILFCKDCYALAFYKLSGPKPTELNEELMLDQLSALANIEGGLENVIHKQLHHAKNISEENQIAYVKLLMEMPSRDIYEKTFGSWFQMLLRIGLLEEGTRHSSRGIRCIARDGHECNSLAEKTIDDWLYSHNIDHEKEPLYPYHFRLNPSKMRADWKVQDILVEFAGMMDEPDYAAKMRAKQEIAEEFGISLIILEPKDILDLDLKLTILKNDKADREVKPSKNIGL